MRIVLGADHAGFEMKQDLVSYVRGLAHEVEDVGTTRSTEPDDYPDFAEAVGKAVAEGKVERGVLICGSGVGASVSVTQVPGIRAPVCPRTSSSPPRLEHDDMNVLVLGSRIIGRELARELVRHFLAAKFSGEERHVRRLGKVKAIEAKFLAKQ